MPEPRSLARRRLLGGAVACLAGVCASTARSADTFRTIVWDDLIPKDWDPFKEFKTSKIGSLMDGSPEAMDMMRQMRRSWDNAPVRFELQGSRVRLPGYVVPLDEARGGVKEFLLVPYFGACIHVPPPPANQIIHVISAKPIKNLRVMDSVWVAGEMKAAHFSKQTDMGIGASAYQINSVSVTSYQEPVISITPYNPR